MNHSQCLVEGQIFANWIEFVTAFSKHKEVTGTVWRKRYSVTARTVNGRGYNMDEASFPYYYLQYVCVYFGKPTNTQVGERVLPCDCNAFFTVNYVKKARCYRLKKFNDVHRGHVPNAMSRPSYPSERRRELHQQQPADAAAMTPNGLGYGGIYHALTMKDKYSKATMVSKQIAAYLSSVGTDQFLVYQECLERFLELVKEGAEFSLATAGRESTDFGGKDSSFDNSYSTMAETSSDMFFVAESEEPVDLSMKADSVCSPKYPAAREQPEFDQPLDLTYVPPVVKASTSKTPSVSMSPAALLSVPAPSPVILDSPCGPRRRKTRSSNAPTIASVYSASTATPSPASVILTSSYLRPRKCSSSGSLSALRQAASNPSDQQIVPSANVSLLRKASTGQVARQQRSRELARLRTESLPPRKKRRRIL